MGGELVREWDWIGNPYLIFSLKPKPIVFVGTKRKEKQGTHTHKKFKTQLWEKILMNWRWWWWEKNLTLQDKMIMKKLQMNSLNLLPSLKVLMQKRNNHIDKKAHSIHLKIQVVILTHPMV